MSYELYREKSPWLVKSLMRDLALADFQALGIVGNTGRECSGFTEWRQENSPPHRGGYGWQQWTGFGPGGRARLFLNWCASHKLEWRSDAANYGYLLHELQDTSREGFAYCVTHLKECHTLEDAVESFMHYYERPGVPALSDRIEWAKIAQAAYQASLK